MSTKHRSRVASRILLDALEPRTLLAASLIPITDYTDIIVDSARNQLLIPRSSGCLSRYDLTTGQFLSSLSLLGSPGYGDISPDGSTLYLTNLNTNTIDRIDLATNAVTYLAYQGGFAENAGYDLVTTSRNEAIFDGQFAGSGSVPLHKIDLGTDTISLATATPSARFETAMNSPLFRSPDHSTVVLIDRRSGVPLYLYDAATDSFTAQAGADGSGYNWALHAALNTTGSRIALPLSTTQIYDRSLHLRSNILPAGAVAFSPVTDTTLYVVPNNSSTVTAYNTETLAALGSIPLGETLTFDAYNRHAMTAITPDGNTLFVTTSSGIRVVDLAPAATTTTLTTSGTLALGQWLTLSAQVVAAGASAAGKSVTFYDGDTVLGTGTISASGVASLQTRLNSPGAHSLTAVYAGDAFTTASTSPALPLTVMAGSTLTLTPSANPSTALSDMTFTAAVTPVSPATGTPTGSVTFLDGWGNPMATVELDANGFATYTTSSLHPGFHTIAATYSGDTLFASSYTSFSFQVYPVAVHITVDPLDPVTYGACLGGIAYHATVTPDIHGTFWLGATANTVLPVGTTTVPINFTPDDTTNYFAYGALFEVTVVPAPLTVTADPQVMAYGEALPGFTGTLTGVLPGEPVTATFTTTATSTSHPGQYDIVPVLSDPAGFLSHYRVTSVNSALTITKGHQTLTWPAPSTMLLGLPLGDEQLNAAAVGAAGGSAPGALTYDPPAGTILPPGLHTLTVTAAGTEDYEQASASVTIDVAIITAPPQTPAGVTASRGTYSDKVVISWDPSAEAQTYRLYVSDSDDPATAALLAENLTATTYDDTLTSQGRHYYWVAAVNALGTSDRSAAVAGYRASSHLIATGPQASIDSTPVVKVFDAGSGAENFEFLAYDARYRGDVRLALGDVTGDGIPDVVTATGRGGLPLVNVYDGNDGHLVGNFWAYIQDYTGGVQVAIADVTGDGRPDIITSTDFGGRPLVNVFNEYGTLLMNFWAYDPNYWGGVRIGAGDFNADGKAEIITSTASGGLPLVNVFNWVGTLVGNFWAQDRNPDGSWYMGGWRCAGGDVNSDGVAEAVLVTDDPSVVPTVKTFNLASQSLVSEFQPYGAALTAGLRVGLTDANADGCADIAIATGPGTEATVTLFDAQTHSIIRSFAADSANHQAGLYLAAG